MQIFKAHGLNSRGLFLLKFDFPLLKFHILLMKFHILLIILYSPSPSSHYCLFIHRPFRIRDSNFVRHPGFIFRPPSGIQISSADIIASMTFSRIIVLI